MKVTPRSEAEARKVSNKSVRKDGWYPANLTAATEKPTRRGHEMIELVAESPDTEEDGFRLLDWLTNNAMGSQKLRHAAVAVGALSKYEAGKIDQSDFTGHAVDVKLATEKSKFGNKNVIVDYALAGTEVTKKSA
jgi:hypothetical protein